MRDEENDVGARGDTISSAICKAPKFVRKRFFPYLVCVIVLDDFSIHHNFASVGVLNCVNAGSDGGIYCIVVLIISRWQTEVVVMPDLKRSSH